MRERIARLMMGRNGVDHFARFTSISACVMLLLSVLSRRVELLSNLFWILGLALLFYSYFRAFSRNIYQRQRENARYLQFQRKVTGFFAVRRDMWRQRKQYRFFKCPSCKATLRVPRGKGKIRVVCRKCGNAFETKT